MASPVPAGTDGLKNVDIRSTAARKFGEFMGGVVFWGFVYYFMLICIPVGSVGLTGLAAYYNYNLNAATPKEINAGPVEAHPIPVSILIVSGLLSLLTLLDAGLKPSAKYTRILLVRAALKFFVDTFHNEELFISLKIKAISEKELVLTQWRIWKTRQLDAIEAAWIRDTDPPERAEFDLEGAIKQAKQPGS